MTFSPRVTVKIEEYKYFIAPVQSAGRVRDRERQHRKYTVISVVTKHRLNATAEVVIWFVQLCIKSDKTVYSAEEQKLPEVPGGGGGVPNCDTEAPRSRSITAGN
ncbi:hypothetical protein XENTR_v10007596 [Xenopus tropicalis]|nr:hypothetical protein XENTR_v10007596 [Xenopus tropicalis]